MFEHNDEDNITVNKALKFLKMEDIAKLSSILSHENTHRLDYKEGRDTYEAAAHANGLNTYEDLKKAFELEGDSAFTDQMLAGLNDPKSYVANSGDIDYFELVENGDGSLGWKEDGSTDFDLSLLGMGTVAAEDMDNGVMSNIMNEYGSSSLQNMLMYLSADGRGNRETFQNGTQSFVDASLHANTLMGGLLSNDNLKLFNSALMGVQESGLLVRNPSEIDTTGLINQGTNENPVYVPVQLGDGQSVHETSSLPGYRLLDLNRGITFHSGIDLRGIWDSDVVAATGDSSVTLNYDDTYGLNIRNVFELNNDQFENRLSHLEIEPTIMSYLKVFGTDGVSLTNNTLSGISAGTILGNVGNTGYSFGAHLDWQTKMNDKPISPLKNKIYKEYLNNDITATAFAKYRSNLPGLNEAESWNSPETWNNFDKYWEETRDTDFLWDLTTIYGIGW